MNGSELGHIKFFPLNVENNSELQEFVNVLNWSQATGQARSEYKMISDYIERSIAPTATLQTIQARYFELENNSALANILESSVYDLMREKFLADDHTILGEATLSRGKAKFVPNDKTLASGGAELLSHKNSPTASLSSGGELIDRIDALVDFDSKLKILQRVLKIEGLSPTEVNVVQVSVAELWKIYAAIQSVNSIVGDDSDSDANLREQFNTIVSIVVPELQKIEQAFVSQAEDSAERSIAFLQSKFKQSF